MTHHQDRRPIVMIGDAGDADADSLGLKGWNLERLHHAGFDTPPAFIVEADVFVETTRLTKIDHRLKQIWLTAADASVADIPMLSRKARHLITQIRFSNTFRQSVQHHLEELASRQGATRNQDELHVAVRSSATPSAVSGPECAGVHTTYLGVSGLEEVLARIASCWASLFGERALSLRAHSDADAEPSMAVIVQTMVNADSAGIITPTGSANEVLIEATFGLGEPIVSGAVEPDRYVLDRWSGDLRSATIGRKQIVLRENDLGAGHEFAAPDRVRARVVDDVDLVELSELSSAIDVVFEEAQEVEWAIDRVGIHVLQVRPVTPAHHVEMPWHGQGVSGTGIGLGWATGLVRVIDSYEHVGELRDHEILVTSETSPEWLPHLQRAAAVITDEGDEHCHAARVAMEEGIPAIVNTGNATTILETGEYVTVDASRGWIVPSVTFANSV